MQPRRAVWTMPLVHSSHSCTICRQPRSPRRASPRPRPRTHTPAYLLRPERPRPPRRLHGSRSLFVALSQHAAKSRPRRSTPRFPGRGKRGEGEAAPAVGRDTRTAWGGGCRSSASTPGRVRGKPRRRRAAGEAPGWGTGSGGA